MCMGEGEQCQWPCRSRLFIFFLLLFPANSRRNADREQKNDMMWCVKVSDG